MTIDDQLQALLEAEIDAIAIIDERGVVETANPGVERLFGYSPSDLVGQNISLLMPSPHRERHGDYIGRYIRTGKARVMGAGRELEGQHRDGTTFPLELARSPEPILSQHSCSSVHDALRLSRRLRRRRARCAWQRHRGSKQ